MSHFEKLSCISFGVDGPSKGLDPMVMAVNPIHPSRLWGTAPRNMWETETHKATARKLLKNRYRRTKTKLSFKQWLQTQK